MKRVSDFGFYSFGEPVLHITDGSLAAKGGVQAIAQSVMLPETYTYWINSGMSDPGGTAFANSVDHKYVRIQPSTHTGTAPAITGPTTMSLQSGYAATSTGAYTIGGTAPVTVTKTSGDAEISWNDTTKKPDISAGLAAGTYTVTLIASNGIVPEATLTFTLTVSSVPAPPLIGGDSLGDDSPGEGNPGDGNGNNDSSQEDDEIEIDDIPVPLAALPFFDVIHGDWFYDAVVYVYKEGLMLGVTGDRFGTNSTLTRAMIVTILYRRAGAPDANGLENPFINVPDGVWFTSAVKWASDKGVVLGYGNGKFGPGDAVTNEQLAVLIYRLQQTTEKIPPDILMDYVHPDWNKVKDWAKSVVDALTKQGVFQDLPDSNFNPQSPVSSGVGASMLYRFLSAVE